MITTGCGYDAWTGAVRRVVTDLDVPGALGSHGLKVVRTYTSSNSIGWSFSWSWQIHRLPFTQDGSYLVNFPDGRAEHFYPPSESLVNAGETAYRSIAGSKERLFKHNIDQSSGTVDLYLEDGSHVHFDRITQLSGDDSYPIDYFFPRSFTDPYGLVTTLVYTQYGNEYNDTHLTSVIDPSGRSLTYHYDPTNLFLTSITASTGQSVSYNADGTVSYSDGTSATYTYAETHYKNSVCDKGICKPFKLATAQDVRAEGPMQSIRYTYLDPGNFQGQVHEEQHLSGLEVSRFNPTNGRGSTSATNTENRGDGPQRSFYIVKSGNAHLLKSKSDFQGHAETYDYDNNKYLSAIHDRNGNPATTFQNEPILGRPLVITHPAGNGYAQSTRTYGYLDPANPDPTNPYYVYSVKDDNEQTTSYQRDPVTHRILEVDYPDGATETFQYNSLGQVTRHKRKNGYYEFADYDATTHLLTTLWNPIASSSHPVSGPHTSFTYYPLGHPWQDRLKDVTDPKGNMTTYEYDLAFDAGGNQTTIPCPGRGLVTKITYPAVAADGGARSSKAYVYDKYGNKLSETDEVGLTTKWTYDEYNRVKSVQLPGFSAKTLYDYTLDRSDGGENNPMAHTDSFWTSEITAAGIETLRSYDENMRLATETTGASDPTIAATNRYHYDNNGNRDQVTDGRGAYLGDPTYTTSFRYDARNRKMSELDPAGNQTIWEYDRNGNITEIDYPDGGIDQRTEYDPMNRLKTQRKLKDAPAQWSTTTFTYYPAGTLWTMIDGNSHKTTFEYDKRFDLQSKMTYDDGSYQTWSYDDNGNLSTHVTVTPASGNPLGKTQVYGYDERNRKTSMGWNNFVWANGQPYENNFSYDPAGKLKTASNSVSSIARDYYPTTGRLKSEATTFKLSSLPAHALQYSYDADGRVTQVTLDPPSDDAAADYDFVFGYDSMGRLQTLQNFHDADVDYQYSYDRASNVTQRFNKLGGGSVDYIPDNLNRTAQRSISLQGRVWSTESYGYDQMDRVKAVSRTENGIASTDAFTYNKLGEMDSAAYTNGSGTPTPTPTVTATPTATPTPTATATPTPSPPAAMPTIYDCGAPQGQPLNVYMETTTGGATIFYTRGGQTCPVTPTHDASGNPTNGTQIYNPLSPPQVASGSVGRFKALAWGNGHSDSPVTACVVEDNTNFNGPSSGCGPSPTPTPTATATATPPPPTPTPCATVSIRDDGDVYPALDHVTMTTGTGGATIFYTVASTSSPPPVTHNGATPTGSTKAYSTPIPLYANTDNYYRALAYKATYTDSRDVVVYEENTDPGRHPHGKKRTKRAAQAPSSTRSLTFNLDNCGNRTSVVDTATGTAVYVPNNLNQYTSVGGSGVTNGPSHEITTYGGTSYYYIGDTYLAQAVSGNNTLQLYYDPLGRCIMRSINDVSTFYIFDGEHWIVEFDTSNVIVSNVLYGRGIDEVIARANHYAPNGSEFQWFYPDRNGNISVVADVTGHVLESYRYDPFGKPTMYAPDGTVRGGSAISNRFLFTGREWRSAFGFYEYRARAYNPTLGRFMSEDPKGFQAGDYNLYRYVGNDPLDRSDPTGLDGEVVIFRPEGRTSVDNDGVIFENGRAVASFRANENGFIPLSSGPTRGARRGEYVLLPKINAKPGDSFPNGQPSVTARPYADSSKPNYAPGRAGPDYRAEGTVRVHKKSSDGSPDSTGCVTACAPAVDRVTKLMNDNIDSGGTRIILIDGKQTVDGHEVRRAEPIVPLRYGE